MSDDNQIFVPPSFVEVHSDLRGRLKLPKEELRLRYELCEDLAQHLSEQAKALEHDMGLSQDLVLQRMHAGLAASTSALGPLEAAWVVRRLAELAGWAHEPGT